MPAGLAWIATLLVGVGAVILLVADHRWVIIGSLIGVIGATAALQAGRAPLRIVLATAIGGLVVCGIIALSTRAGHWRWARGVAGALPQGRPFRIVAGAFMAVGMAGLGSSLGEIAPSVSLQAQVAGALLAGLGALQMGLSEQSQRFGIGLLTVLFGFSLVYLLMEPSLAIALLLSGVAISIALVVSYLVAVVGSEEQAEGRD